MSDNLKLYLLIFISSLCFVIIWQLPRHFRSKRLKSIAEKYKLTFIKDFSLFYPDHSYNKISGSIKGHNVMIYDSVSRGDFGPEAYGIYSYRTILQIDGVQTQSIEKYFAGVRFIEEKLKELTD